MKNLSNLDGAKALSSNEQKNILGGKSHYIDNTICGLGNCVNDSDCGLGGTCIPCLNNKTKCRIK